MEFLVLYGAVFIAALLVMAAGIGLYLSRTELRNQQPVDPATLLDAIDESVVVLDADDTVLMANVGFRSLFDDSPIGSSLDVVLSDYPTVLAAMRDEAEGAVELDTRTGPRYFDVCLFPLGRGIHEDRKRLALFHDVTERVERERKLERQNERLEEFASIISHDLRNPLDVAIGRTNAVRDQVSEPELAAHLDDAHDAHHRMKHIITEVLALAREGKQIDDKTAVALESAATTAWGHVETGDASLVIDTDVAVRADEDALVRLFENLFRNAVEHGSASNHLHVPDDTVEHEPTRPQSQDSEGVAEHDSPRNENGKELTVRVGDLDGGFFVADDGVGVPADDRAVVFEPGYTGSDTGTGLGLSIVRNIAEAHGWELRMTSPDDGGVQFEFINIEQVAGEMTAEDAA